MSTRCSYDEKIQHGQGGVRRLCTRSHAHAGALIAVRALPV